MLRRVFASFTLFAAFLQGAVTRVDVTERVDLPVNGYERIAGKVYFAMDPRLPANRAIVDIDLAPRNVAGAPYSAGYGSARVLIACQPELFASVASRAAA